MLNSGILHHVGPCRLHVTIGRALASAGVATLRFYFSGIGDSDPRRHSIFFNEGAVIEVREAMDYLAAKTGAQRFVLLGLCSGADAAFETAKADTRVVGIVSIDGFAYRTLRYYVHYYGPRMLRMGPWINFSRRQVQRLLRSTRLISADESNAMPPRPSRFPPKQQVASDLRSLVARGVHQFYIYTGGVEHYYTYRRQFQDSFRSVKFGDFLRVEYFGGCDHVFSDLQYQDRLVSSVCAWVDEKWPGSDGADHSGDSSVGSAPQAISATANAAEGTA